MQKYWLKGGIIYTVVGIIVVPIVIFILFYEPRFLEIAIVGLFLFGPAWITIGMELGMRGVRPEIFDYIVAILLGIFLQLLYSFIIGTILGGLYGLYGKFVIRKKNRIIRR